MTFEAKVTPWQRLGAIRATIEEKGFARIIEAHNGISGLIGETVSVMKDGHRVAFDGFWESSLTDSASKGLPDVELIGSESRLHTIDEILTVTTKPLIVDGDTGGESDAFRYLIQRLERRGVSAVIIEDKVFPNATVWTPMLSNISRIQVHLPKKSPQGKKPRLPPILW